MSLSGREPGQWKCWVMVGFRRHGPTVPKVILTITVQLLIKQDPFIKGPEGQRGPELGDCSFISVYFF